MSRICCVPNCKLRNDDPGCTKMHFFQLPKNEDTKKKWFDNIQNHFKEDVYLKKYTYVCERHFELNCFNYGPLGKNLRLTKGSCPTIFDNYEYREQYLCANDDNSISEENVAPKESGEDSPRTSAPISNNILEKSISKINLDLVDLKNEDLVRLLLLKAQTEYISLRKQLKHQTVRLHQSNKRVKDFITLVSQLKDEKLLPENVSKILEVYTQDLHKNNHSQEKIPTESNVFEVKLTLTNGLFTSNNVTLQETSINNKVVRIPLKRYNFNALKDINTKMNFEKSMKRKRSDTESLIDEPKRIKLNGSSVNTPFQNVTPVSDVTRESSEKENKHGHLNKNLSTSEDVRPSKTFHKSKFKIRLYPKSSNKKKKKKLPRTSLNGSRSKQIKELSSRKRTSQKMRNNVNVFGTGNYYLKFKKDKVITEGKLNYAFQKLIADVKNITLPTVTWKIKVNIKQTKISSITITNKQDLERSVSFFAVADSYKLVIDNRPAYLLGSPDKINAPEDIEILLDILEQLEASSQIILYK